MSQLIICTKFFLLLNYGLNFMIQDKDKKTKPSIPLPDLSLEVTTGRPN